MSEQRDSQDQNGGDDQRERRGRTTAENITLAISLGVVLTLIGLLGYQWYTQEDRKTAFEFQFDTARTRHTDGHYFVPLQITNTGSETVSDLWLRIELRGVRPPDESPPFSELRIRFLAGGETLDAEVGFHQDPAQGELIARAVSYLKP